MTFPSPRRLANSLAAIAVAVGFVACTDDSESTDSTTEPGGIEDRDPLRVGPQGNVAQFIVECELSHLAYDDPIVLPDMPGESHLHQFFGNTEITADPDYDAVIDADTTCSKPRDTASYWAPALLDDRGNVIEPLKMTAYYRPGPGIDPATVEPYPASLMMVGGNSSADESQALNVIAWSCGTGALRAVSPPDCRDRSELAGRRTAEAGTSLRLLITFPDCWDGDRLSSFGSGAHVRASSAGVCPETHPVPIPQLVMAIDFPAVDPQGLSLASGGIETAHADFWNVWDQEKLVEEVRLCLNRDLVCGVAS